MKDTMGVGVERFTHNATGPVGIVGVCRFQHKHDSGNVRVFVSCIDNGISNVVGVAVKKENLFAFHPVFQGSPGQSVRNRKALLNVEIKGTFQPVVTIQKRLNNVVEGEGCEAQDRIV